jgi:hypothetical protein
MNYDEAHFKRYSNPDLEKIGRAMWEAGIGIGVYDADPPTEEDVERFLMRLKMMLNDIGIFTFTTVED